MTARTSPRITVCNETHTMLSTARLIWPVSQAKRNSETTRITLSTSLGGPRTTWTMKPKTWTPGTRWDCQNWQTTTWTMSRSLLRWRGMCRQVCLPLDRMEAWTPSTISTTHTDLASSEAWRTSLSWSAFRDSTTLAAKISYLGTTLTSSKRTSPTTMNHPNLCMQGEAGLAKECWTNALRTRQLLAPSTWRCRSGHCRTTVERLQRTLRCPCEK